MVQKLKMSHLRNSEFLGFHKNALAIVMQNDPATLNVEAATTAYSGKIAELEGLYKQDAFNPITAELEEADHQRDEVFSGIVNLLAGNANHFMPDMKEAAQLLQRDLEKYGANFVRESYVSETTDLENIIADWRSKPELSAAVTKLGILSWITELERVNQLFNTKYIARTASYAAETDETTKGKRVEVTAAYDELCKYLNSYAFLNDTPEYRTTISEINALIDQYSVMLKQRRGKTASAKKAADNPPVGSPQ